MNTHLRKTLIASAVAALVAAPVWAAGQPEYLAQAAPEQSTDLPERAPGQSIDARESAPGQSIGAPESAPGQSIGAPESAPGQAMDRPEGAPGQAMDTPPLDSGPGLASPEPSVTDHPLYARTPDDLTGSDVVDHEGEKIGKVKAVVLSPDRNAAHAVISVGGILGLGATDYVVALEELQLAEDDDLQISATREELEARGEYVPEMYVELERDRPISEFSAFEPTPDERAPDAGMPVEPPRTPQ